MKNKTLDNPVWVTAVRFHDIRVDAVIATSTKTKLKQIIEGG
jgi:hypothetical protein